MTPMGMMWDGEYLWSQDPRYGDLYRIDPETGEGGDTPYMQGLTIDGEPIYPCGLSWDEHSCMWISDLNKGLFIQVDPTTGEAISYLDPPDNPDPAKYGAFRPSYVTKLFTGMTTDGRRVWAVDEVEGNPLVYEVAVDFPTTGPCAHPVETGEFCVPEGEPFCGRDALCVGEADEEI